MSKFSKIITLAVFMSLAVAGARQAHAVPMLSIDDGTTFVTVSDNGAGDNSAMDGFINYSPLVSPFDNFMAAVSFGTTKPVAGSAAKPSLELFSVNITGTGAAADLLTIKFTDTDFSDPSSGILGFSSVIDGSTSGTVTYASYFDNSNAAFGTATLLSDLGSFSGGSFSGTAFASLASLSPAPAGPYSLTLVTTVATPAGSYKDTHYNAIVSVPEPGTLLLLGSGMLGFAFFRRRKG